MANLRLPEACTACGHPLKDGDKIEFTRRATVVATPGHYRYGRRPYALEPRVEAHSPRDVRHLACPE